MPANITQVHEANIQIIQAKAKELGWAAPDGNVPDDLWNRVIDVLDQENPLWRGYPVNYQTHAQARA